ncbi:MAG: hypothetical protein LRY36_02400 [Alphaproteobacteria bacterium]|nr:hypothetical protein [Alphaproteobacteria bacterium]
MVPGTNSSLEVPLTSIDTRLSGSYGHSSVLPARVVPYKAPLTSRDVLVTNPADQAAIDSVLYRAVCETRANMEPGARLYIVIGEEHATTTHRMAQAGLLDNLATAVKAGQKEHGQILYSYEFPYNFLQTLAYRHYGLPLKKRAQQKLHETDPLGHHFMRAALANNPLADARQSLYRIFNTCLQHQIPLIMADAARNNKIGHLCPSDRLAGRTARSLHKITRGRYPELDLKNDRIGPASASGTVIRNAVMARRIITAAERNNAGTIITATGFAHMSGDSFLGLDYENVPDSILKQRRLKNIYSAAG